MAFWTSKEPGVLPKWIFWWNALQVPVFLSELEQIAASWALIAAISARRNEIGFLIFLDVIAVIAGGYVLWASANVSSPGYLSSKGWSTDYVVAVMAYCALWIWYLNRYRLKGGSTPLPPSTLKPHQTDSVEETPANDAAVAMGAEEAHPDIYAEELELFEAGDLEQSLWAKHIVEAEGDSEKAKWRYIKERVTTAPSRNAEQERIRTEREAARVAEREASERAERDEVIRVRAEAARRKRGEELARGNRQFLGLIVVVTVLVIFVVF